MRMRRRDEEEEEDWFLCCYGHISKTKLYVLLLLHHILKLNTITLYIIFTGDSRFDGVRNVPSRFVLFWIVQGVWVYCISTPLLLVVEQASHPFTVTSATTTTNNNTDDDANPIVFVLVLLGMTLAIVVEIASDITKARWVAHGRPGGYCVDGFWNFSRHPNYAGEIGTWVCAAVYAILLRQPDPASSSSSFFSCSGVTTVLLAALSPGVTLHLLCNTPATGIWHAEGKALKRYYEPTAVASVASPASSIHHPHAPINDDDDDDDDLPRRYATYWHTTPPIFPNLLEPLLPYEFLPVWIKRSFCFEWERYAYKTTKNRTTTTKPKTH